MPVRRSRAVVCLVLCVAALVAGCTVGPSERPPVAVRGENVPAPPSVVAAPTPAPPPLPEPDPARTTLDFRPCTGGNAAPVAPAPADRSLAVDCAQLTVEADPQQPGLSRNRIGLVRVGLADAPADRPPLLVVGDSATRPAAILARVLAGQVPLPLLQRYTLVGLDRRGAGIDDLDCGPSLARTAFVDIDPGSDGAAGLDLLLEQARTVVADCYIVHGGALAGYRTSSTAVDVEQVRQRLGLAHLSALGVGDGATALASWARAHPDAVGRLVLDGPPDALLDEPDAGEARAAAAESAFDAFAAACAAGPDCPLGADPRAVVGAVVERLRTQPITSVDGRRLTAGMTVTALLAGLGEPAGWPDLATAIGQVNGGSPDALLGRLTPVLSRGGGFDVALATSCNDARRRLTPVEVAEVTARWRGAYPLFGSTLAQRLLMCGPWPPATGTPSPDAPGGLPPVLVIGTAHDPRGPMEGARRVAAGTPGALFLSWQGAGTGAYPRTPCVTAAVDALLVDGVVPADGTLCPP